MNGKGKLQTAEKYLEETESAVKKLLEGLRRYSAILKKIKFPVFIAPYTSDQRAAVIAFKDWQGKNKKIIKQAKQKESKYFGYQFSKETLCGSVLQIAHAGINLYSKKQTVPSEFSRHIKAGTRVAKFCIGRRLRGVPIGLIIYAGRNQYNHMDEKTLKEPNRYIFDLLAVNHGMKGAENIKDPAFDLENSLIYICAANVLFILGWDSYDAYFEDMKKLLIP